MDGLETIEVDRRTELARCCRDAFGEGKILLGRERAVRAETHRDAFRSKVDVRMTIAARHLGDCRDERDAVCERAGGEVGAGVVTQNAPPVLVKPSR